jgi:hypothetical protein
VSGTQPEPGADPPPPPGRDYQAQADALLAQVLDGLSAEEAALALAVLASRVATRLHNLARGEAAQRKGQPDWGSWAQLQNASRTGVLQASTCRDLAQRLTGHGR